MEKLTRLLKEARNLTEAEPRLLLRIIPQSDGVCISGYLAYNERKYLTIREYMPAYKEALERVRELQKQHNISNSECVMFGYVFAGPLFADN